MRALVVVENRPVPEAREWSVTLLYDPAPHERQQGRMTLETSALCHHAHGDARLRMGQREL
jgi:hypothetical protein